MHGVRRSLLEAQATSIGLPLVTVELPDQPSMQEYELLLLKQLSLLKDAGCTHAIFGDIFLEDLKAYREAKLKELEMACVFPLWKMDTTALATEFIQSGFKSIVVCVNDLFLDKSFCGRIIDQSFLEDLPANVDPCGEHGEFHSFCFEGPIFREAIPFSTGELLYRKYDAPTKDVNNPSTYGFYFLDLF
jgi:uncharacterized protein (TIGR00290 family)